MKSFFPLTPSHRCTILLLYKNCHSNGNHLVPKTLRNLDGFDNCRAQWGTSLCRRAMSAMTSKPSPPQTQCLITLSSNPLQKVNTSFSSYFNKFLKGNPYPMAIFNIKVGYLTINTIFFYHQFLIVFFFSVNYCIIYLSNIIRQYFSKKYFPAKMWYHDNSEYNLIFHDS